MKIFDIRILNTRSPIIGITVDIDNEYLRLKEKYPEAIVRAGGIPVLIPPADNAATYARKIDGLLIPGGADLDPSYYNEPIMPAVKPVSRKRSDFEFSLLKEVVHLKKPVLGICYGMQLINVAFGGTLYQDINSELPEEINHRSGNHIILITENRFLKKGEFSVNSTHHQAVKNLGTGLKVFAFSSDKIVEALDMEDYPFFIGVQWHPERLMDSLSLDLFGSFVKASGKINLQC
ncbi:MAG: gamma-glutamyl-gamma-aminobutyrate hydrolase family protein [Nitrospirota bacterium]